MVNKKHNSFPDELLSNTEKANFDFGEKVAIAIDDQWFSNSKLTLRRLWITKMRKYGRGEQDTKQYKTMIQGDRVAKDANGNEIKTHKIDYTPLKVMNTFKDILANSIDESLFKPRAEAIDETSVDNKKKYFKRLEEQFNTRDIAEEISKNIGVNLMPKNSAKDKDELRIKKMEYKPRLEMVQELAIENVMKREKFETIKDKIDEDLIDLGIGVGRHYSNMSEGIKTKYVDPYNYIHNDFETEDGRDIRYHGVLERATISEIVQMAGGEMDQDNLLLLKNKAIGDYKNTQRYNEEEDGHRIVEYLVFAYKTGEEKIYKKLRKNKSVKAIDRSSTGYNPENPSKKISIPYQVWYEGVYVPSAKIMISWNKIENQVSSEIGNPISPFIVYAPKVKRLSENGSVRFDSLVERAKPIIDDLHRDWYKFQQLKMELRPNTVTINTTSLNNVTLNGQKVDAQDLLDLFFGRGLLLATDVDEEGDRLPPAITENNGGVNNNAVTLLSQEFASNYNRLRQLLGINELRDGTTKPNSKTAVAVQKLLLASSNNATNHVVKASFNISLRFAESISNRLVDVLRAPNLKNYYKNVIGSDNVEFLEEFKDVPMAKFAIYFDFKPDNEERIAFENSLIESYSKQEINVAQYNKARQIKNVKNAIRYLEHIVEKNREILEENKRKNIQAQAEAQAQTSVLTEQVKQQTLTIEYETKKAELLLKEEIEDRQARKKALTDDLLAERKFQRDYALEELRANAEVVKRKELEDRKDARIDKQSSNTSELIEQRQNNTAPKNFENEIAKIFQ